MKLHDPFPNSHPFPTPSGIAATTHSHFPLSKRGMGRGGILSVKGHHSSIPWQNRSNAVNAPVGFMKPTFMVGNSRSIPILLTLKMRLLLESQGARYFKLCQSALILNSIIDPFGTSPIQAQGQKSLLSMTVKPPRFLSQAHCMNSLNQRSQTSNVLPTMQSRNQR